MSANSCVVEIRPGSGGDEAKDFVRILSRMYQRYAARSGWAISALDEGNSMTTFMLEGRGVDRLATEIGVHCIQRIPPNRRKSGKVHTTTASVAVLPVVADAIVNHYEHEFRVETMRGTGKGGQNRNKVESAVRITHIPTGLSAICRDERSQAANRERAMRVLRARVLYRMADVANVLAGDMRRTQIGAAMRAERFRTYDVPEDRLVDRRSGKRVQNLGRIFDGYLEEVIEPRGSSI